MDTIIAFWIFLLKQILKKVTRMHVYYFIFPYVVTFIRALFLCGFELVSSVLTVHHEGLLLAIVVGQVCKQEALSLFYLRISVFCLHF